MTLYIYSGFQIFIFNKEKIKKKKRKKNVDDLFATAKKGKGFADRKVREARVKFFE